MNRKDYSKPMMEEVTELEEHIKSQTTDIWCDPVQREYFVKLLSLTLSDRRLWLVYSLLNHSIINTAKHFKCDRKTISNNINRIKNELI